jgi:hypothetical protein
MNLVQKEIQVTKETNELFEGLISFIGTLKEAYESDGFGIDDIPDIASSAMVDFAQALNGLGDIPDEIKTHGKEFKRTVALGMADLIDELEL